MYKKFQFLIGIINPCLVLVCHVSLIPVSIPHRYYKSIPVYDSFNNINLVSIPHRYYKSLLNLISTLLSTVFQFLIGIINPSQRH